MYLFGHALMSVLCQSCLTFCMMCNVCCKEFKGWCKSFTKTEILLCVLQAISLMAFIALLTFLVLHLVVCYKNKQKYERPTTNSEGTIIENLLTTTSVHSSEENNELTTNISLQSHITITSTIVLIDRKDKTIEQNPTTKDNKFVEVQTISTEATTSEKGITCTWKPPEKTDAVHYYENGQTSAVIAQAEVTSTVVKKEHIKLNQVFNEEEALLEDNSLLEDTPDGVIAGGDQKDFLLALVKIKPPQDVTFGCTLTVVSSYWTLTAASCIEAIEEVESLDSFVMMQGFSERSPGSLYSIADVMIHPQYQGVNVTYDLAALKSENNILTNERSVVTLPSLLDYFLVTIGERLTMLGFGRFRSLDNEPWSEAVRQVAVHRVPAGRCSRADGLWAQRHLAAGRPVAAPACSAGPLCAGVLRPGAAPCTYCAGTPLLSGRLLLGIMSDNPHCGLACEPALFASLSLVKDWLDSVLNAE